MVIPVMDVIDEKLTTDSLKNTYKPSIRAALNLGKATLNRYYNKTDASESYRIAMGECSCSVCHVFTADILYP